MYRLGMKTVSWDLQTGKRSRYQKGGVSLARDARKDIREKVIIVGL